MQLTLRDDLPFVSVTITHAGRTVEVPHFLVDTGSAGSLLSADSAADLGIVPEPGDRLRTLRGVGGREVVFTRRIDRIAVGARGLDRFLLEIGGMDYGFAIDGILGIDFLTAIGAVLDLGRLSLD